ncbi:Endoglycosylceramidase [Giardia muris]|uniref:Endoglycosylceramidase n=1 Tax=Giardia muris TaxID=5742 RepID=A0A4Z1SM72_GIAMU|nr:Endoglycosylceramidase [Giardia muris]|eukprot:TNJ26786.1 Endoglycosylceramidase [Giardia muris]
MSEKGALSYGPLGKLRGVNVSSYSKGMVFDPIGLQPFGPLQEEFRPFGELSSEACIACIRSLGFNAVRLLLLLEGCYTPFGKLNWKYLDGVISIARLCNRHGLFLLIDFHQDNYSRRLGGSGLPDAFLPSHLRQSYRILPHLGESWGSQPLLDSDQAECWISFWENQIIAPLEDWPCLPVQDLYVDCIGKVIQALQERCKIDAIDIINEPCLPEIYLARFLIMNNSHRIRQLQEFYIRACTRLKDYNIKYLLIEPFNYDVSYITRFRLGLDGFVQKLRSVIPSLDQTRLVFAPHCYQPLGRLGPSITKILRNHQKSMRKGGFEQMLIGEFGDTTYGRVKGHQIMREQLEAFKNNNLGWFLWEFCPTYQANEEDSVIHYRITGDMRAFPWNGEYCSIVYPDLEPAPIFSEVVEEFLKT